MLMLGSEVLLPHWPAEFLAGIPPYLRYTQAATGIQKLLGSIGGTIVLAGMAVVVVLAAWRTRLQPATSDEFKLGLSLVFAVTCIAIPSLAPHNQVLLTPACLLLVKERKHIWAIGRIARALWAAAFFAVAWPWAAGAALATTLLFHHPLSPLWDLPLATNPLISITVFAALLPLLVPIVGDGRVMPEEQAPA